MQQPEDLRATLLVSQTEALLGATRILTLPGNRRITFSIPAGVYDDQQIRLQGEGQPSTHGGLTGDLVITIKLERTRLVYVFFSYARQDKALRDKLEDHLSNLKYRGLISTWHDRDISAGTEWAQQIDIHLDTADIILLLISSSFMASDYCYSIEMKRAIERHERKEARVIPILLRPVLFTDAPFAKFQFLPRNAKPIVEWRNRDRAFVDIALGLERVVQEHLAFSGREIAVVTPLPSSPGAAAYSPFSYSEPLVGGISSPQGSIPSPPPAIQRSKYARLVSLAILGGLVVAGILLLVQHPNVLPLVGAIVGGLILLLGVIAAFRAVVKREREQRAQEEMQRLQEEFQRSWEERRAERQQREQESEYYEKALVAYDKALLLDFTDATALRGKGNALEALGRYSEALEAFERSVNLDTTPAAYVGKGRVLFKLKRYDESLVAYERAIELDPAFASAYAEMSETLEQLGRSEEAQQAREKAKQLGYEE